MATDPLGFDFLQGLMKSGGALPSLGPWAAPTLDPAELEKRIAELRAVQFWLEQNTRLIETTVQALEVQRMTLATLQSLNVPLADVQEALKIKPEQAAAVDPMQWWNALTQQFAQIAGAAVQAPAAAPVKKARKTARKTPPRPRDVR